MESNFQIAYYKYMNYGDLGSVEAIYKDDYQSKEDISCIHIHRLCFTETPLITLKKLPIISTE